jgi:glycogen debranching enzyme
MEEEGYLADYISDEGPNRDVRPNMVIAASMDHSMLTQEMKNSILEVVRSELLTPRGLRTLSPKNPDYQGIYEGDQYTRDHQYHQGTVWPWLLEHYAKAYLDVNKKAGVSQIKQLLFGFEEDMTEYGMSSIAEIYDGDPPHKPRGAISQAWSVAALLRINEMIEKLSTENNESNL